MNREIVKPTIIVRSAGIVIKRASVASGDRTLTGLASSPKPDRLGDVVEPFGVQFKTPLPLLWQHQAREPVGKVTHVDVSRAGLHIRATFAKKGVSPRIDEAWALVRAGIVNGFSIGFRILEKKPLPDGAYRFTKTELLEVSCVTVPANADATITDAQGKATGGKQIKRWEPRLWRAGELLKVDDAVFLARRDVTLGPWKAWRSWEKVA